MAQSSDVLKGHFEPLDLPSDKNYEEEADRAKELEVVKDKQHELCSIMEDKFRIAVQHKESLGITCRLRNAWYSYRQEYRPEILCKMDENTPDVYMGIFAMQHRTALAWYGRLVTQVENFPATMMPTPKPSLPKSVRDEIINEVTQRLINGEVGASTPDVREAIREELGLTIRLTEQRAAAIAAKHQRVIEDQFAEGGWVDAYAEARHDLLMYPNAILFGPAPTVEKRLSYEGNKVKFSDKLVYKQKTVSPFCVFPMPDVGSDPNTGEGIFVVQELSADQLVALKQDNSSYPENIEHVLEDNSESGWWAGYLIKDESITGIESGYYASRNLSGSDEKLLTFSVVNFIGNLRAEHAYCLGLIEKNEVESMGSIPIHVMMCDGRILWAAKNNHPLGRRPIHTSSYMPVPRSFWGVGLHDILEDVERRACKTLRSLIIHSATALGFYGELDMQRIGRNPVSDVLKLNQILRTDGDYTRGGHSALKFHSIDSKIGDIIALLENYIKEAENLTGINRFMGGSTDLGSALRTSGIVNALQENSSSLLTQAQRQFDQKIIKPLIEYQYALNMMYHEDASIKGDLMVVVKGTNGLAQKELYEKKFEQVMQYAGSIVTQTMPDGTPYLDPRDFKEMLVRYFRDSGSPLTFSTAPSEIPSNSIPPDATMGTGGMSSIDGRSSPRLGGGAVPI